MKSAKTVRLGDLGTIIRGKGIRRAETTSHGKPCLRYGEIYTSYQIILDKPKSFVPEAIFNSTEHIRHGDLVFTLTGENKEDIGKTLVYLGDDEIAAGGDLAIWRVPNCNPKWLCYLMQSGKMHKAKAIASSGNMIVHLSLRKFQEIEIPLPPLSEQKAIVARLDAALARATRLAEHFTTIAKNADLSFKAALAETFTHGSGESRGSRNPRFPRNSREPSQEWPLVRFGNVCELKNGFTPKPDEITATGDVPYFRVASMNEPGNEIFMEKPIGFYIGRNKRRFPKGSVVFPKNGGAALTHKVRFLAQDAVVDLNTGVFLPSRELDTYYLFYWFSALPIERISVIGTLPFVDFQRLAEYSIPLPPLSVQRAIVSRLDAARKRADGIATLARQAAEAAENLKKALLKEAFE